MLQDSHNDVGRVHELAVAAAFAVLGVSVGVNVQELLAVEPDQLQSGQAKFGYDSSKWKSTQFKENSMQQKLDATQKHPSIQQKDRGMPGMKRVDPSR